MGLKEDDDRYSYKEKGYTVSYIIQESSTGIKNVEWLSLKRRLTFLEEKILNIKRDINKFFLYQRWVTLFRPSAIIILTISLIIFYLGIKENSLRRIERFRWIAAKITGVSIESIEYTGEGKFKVTGKRNLLDRVVDPVTISFNPIGWLFFSDAVNINRWNTKLNKYNTYSVTMSDKGDVRLEKKTGRFHGRALGGEVIWDKPPDTMQKVSGEDVIVEDGKLKFIDE
jgi:hypothetical protein